MLNIPAEYDRDSTSSAKLMDFLAKFLVASLLGVSAGICQRALEMIRIQMRITVDQNMTVVHGTLYTVSPRNSNQYLTFSQFNILMKHVSLFSSSN
jgi:hypothetical protein